MPTIISHAAVPLAIGIGLGRGRIPSRLLLTGVVAAIAPDLDVVAFKLGIAYADTFGHRGASHSLLFALLLAAGASAAAPLLRTSGRTSFFFIRRDADPPLPRVTHSENSRLNGAQHDCPMPPSSFPLHIRPVTDADLPAICAFSQDSDELFFWYPKATFPLSPSQLRDAIEQRSDSTVVEFEGRVVGFANLYRWARGGICSIGNVVVCPTARGRGVARRLVEEMVAVAFARHGAAEVTVSCFNANVTGLLVYPRLGFQPYAIEQRQDRNGKPVALIHLRHLRNGSP